MFPTATLDQASEFAEKYTTILNKDLDCLKIFERYLRKSITIILYTVLLQISVNRVIDRYIFPPYNLKEINTVQTNALVITR